MEKQISNYMDKITTFLSDIYGDLLDTVCLFFYPTDDFDDFDEFTKVKLGIVLAGQASPEMRQEEAALMQAARMLCDAPFGVVHFTVDEFQSLLFEDLDVNTYYWRYGRRCVPPQLAYSPVVFGDEVSRCDDDTDWPEPEVS